MEPKKRTCPYCNSEIIITSPWKNLWRKPTLNEWITLFIMVMMIFGAWAYKHDTQICRDYIANIDKICANRQSTIQTGSPQYSPYNIGMNTSNVTIETKENDSGSDDYDLNLTLNSS